MKILPNDLPDDVGSLKALLLEQAILLDKKDSELTQWQSKYQLILEQWLLAQQKQFGKSAEVSPGQGELFDESATATKEDRSDVEPDTQTVSYTRTKPKRKSLPKDLPRETVVVDFAEAEKTCSCRQS